MVVGPHGIALPPSFTLIDDADEEIFLLYTRKLSLGARTEGSGADGATLRSEEPGGLGFLSTKEGVLPIHLRVAAPSPSLPPLPASPRDLTTRLGVQAGKSSRRREKKGAKPKRTERIEEFDLLQDLGALRNRAGDTGSVLWRVSKHLALHLLHHLSFPSPHSPTPLLAALFTPETSSLSPSTPTRFDILELGSGTAFLGLALLPLLSELHGAAGGVKWTFTDQAVNLHLIARNLTRNEGRLGCSSEADTKGDDKTKGETGGHGGIETEVREVDWLYPPSPSATSSAEDPWPDLIIASDCLYNPSLSLPLFRTIDALASPIPGRTAVIVASELRDQEALEGFLGAWISGGGWNVGRVGFGHGGEDEELEPVEQGIGGKDFVVWVGWRVAENSDSNHQQDGLWR